MVEIIPAIMPDCYDDFVQKAKRVKGIVPCAQIDIMDGIFVDSISWPYSDGGDGLHEFIKNNEYLPFWDELGYEIDLMVSNPESVINDWIQIGARRIIVHIESTNNLGDIIANLDDRIENNEDFDVHPVEFGIALNTTTVNETIYPYTHDIDFVQFMGIEKIGYQGQSFDERVLDKISDLRHECPHIIISVDGGVSLNTAPRLIDAGADRLVSGSTIFGSKDIRKVIEELSI